MSEPYEIIVAPFEVYLAPVGEAWPDVDTTPAGNWVKLGTNGKRNIADGGVTVTHEQTIVEKRNVGSTGPIKAVRTEEKMTISLTLEDLSLEQYAKALNNVTVTDTAAGSGTPGYRKIPLRQGNDVSLFALLLKGTASAYGDGLSAQYQVPVCYQSDNPAPVFNKADVAALKLTFSALEDPNAASDDVRFGNLVMQDAAALP